MTGKMESWEIWLMIGAVAFFSYYAYNHIDFENIFKPDSSVPVHITGIVAPGKQIKDVKIIDIPQDVYDTMQVDSDSSRYLKGNQKYILTIHSSSCPYSNAFNNAFKQIFKEGSYSEYYRKRIFEVGRSGFVSCKSEFCSKIWIYNNCNFGFCIVNPIAKQAVVYESRDKSHIRDVLEKYKEW